MPLNFCFMSCRCHHWNNTFWKVAWWYWSYRSYFGQSMAFLPTFRKTKVSKYSEFLQKDYLTTADQFFHHTILKNFTNRKTFLFSLIDRITLNSYIPFLCQHAHLGLFSWKITKVFMSGKRDRHGSLNSSDSGKNAIIF